MITVSYVLASLMALAYAGPTRRSTAIHNMLTSVPRGFVSNGVATGEQTLTLRFGLMSNNMGALENELYAVSTPGSPRYGQHLTKEEVHFLLRLIHDLHD